MYLVGHARTFSIAAERAAKNNGILLLRVEDIDLARCKPHYFMEMAEDLQWLCTDFEYYY